MLLSEFRNHPNPLETGVIEKSDSKCHCFGTATGHIYTGHLFAEEELDEFICLWCRATLHPGTSRHQGGLV